jgi:hypothetical protein
MRTRFRSSSRMRFRSSRRIGFGTTRGDGDYSNMREDGGDAARVGWRSWIWQRALGEVVERRGGGGQGRREEESAHDLTLYGPAATKKLLPLLESGHLGNCDRTTSEMRGLSFRIRIR